MKIKELITITTLILSSFAVKAAAVPEKIIQSISENDDFIITLQGLVNDATPPYQLIIHSEKINKLLKNDYSIKDLKNVIQETEKIRKLDLLELHDRTLLEAATFEDNGKKDDTHYNAIWVRDSLWGYLAMKTENDRDIQAKKLLLTLWDYFSSDEQIHRLNKIIKTPGLFVDENGQMDAVHIRFDGQADNYEDIKENGKPQQWNHKQNDAIGLFVDVISNAIISGELTKEELLEGKRIESLIKLIVYLDSIHFSETADSGPWEENERINTSSVALVTSALETFRHILIDNKHSELKNKIVRISKKSRLAEHLTLANVDKMIEQGYNRINKNLNLSGESPDYNLQDSRYRSEDAALLNLVYPARLTRLKTEDKIKILKLVENLSGPVGIKRYKNDTYQSANFWFNGIKTDTDNESHSKRENSFVPHTEAQWFFDSWLAKSYLIVYAETDDAKYYGNAIKYMNRSLAQITGKMMYGADGKQVPENSLPESYNYLRSNGRLYLAPSPIIPLNWAKSSMTIMLKHFEDILSAN